MLGILSTPFGSLIKLDCSLHITKHLSTLDNNFVTESVPEKCTKTIHVLEDETECVQLLQQLFNVSY